MENHITTFLLVENKIKEELFRDILKNFSQTFISIEYFNLKTKNYSSQNHNSILIVDSGSYLKSFKSTLNLKKELNCLLLLYIDNQFPTNSLVNDINIDDYFYKHQTNEEILIRIQRKYKNRKLSVVKNASEIPILKSTVFKTDNLKKIFDLLPLGLRIIDREFNIIYANKAYAKYNNINDRAIEGKKCYELLCSKNCESHNCSLLKILSTGEAIENGLTIYNGKDKKYYIYNALPLFSAQRINAIIETFRDVTELKNRETDLKKFEVVTNQNPVAIVITDSESKIEYANKRFAEVSGYTFDELKGKTPSVLNSGYHTNDFYDNLWETIKAGNVWYGTFQNKHKNGNFYWEKATISPVIGTNGEIIHFIGMKEDITEQVKAENALRKSEERFRELADNIKEVFWLFDWKKQKVIYASPAFEDIWGKPIDDLLNDYSIWEKSIYPDDIEYANTSFKKVIETDVEVTREYRIVTSDGQIRWISDRSAAIKGAQGEIYRIAGVAEDITTKKQAEEALKKSEEKFRIIFEYSNLGVVLGNPDGTINSFNPAFCNMLGYKTDELKNIDFKVFTHPIDYEKEIVLLMEIVSRKRENYSIEKRYIKKNGNIIWVQVNVAVFRNPEGEVELFIAIVDDISERKKTEKALIDSKERLKEAQHIAKLGSYETDLSSGTWQGSKEFLHIFGLKEDRKFSMKEFQELVHPDDFEAVMKQFSISLSTGTDFNYDYRCINKENGKTIYITSRSKIIKDKKGRAIKIRGIKQDITERKMVENALKKSEEFNKRIIENNRDCIKVLDIDGRILYLSPGGKILFEIEDITVYLNKSWPELWQGQYKKRAEKALKEVKAGHTITYTGFASTEKGTPKWWDVTVTPINSPDGFIERILVVSKDITSQKNYETQLKKAKDEAIQANKSKSIFLANMSHEIRTPMNAVLGFADLLANQVTNNLHKKYVRSIKSSGNTLLNIINDILDLSKIEAGKLEIIKEPVNINTIFKEINHIFSIKIKEKGLDLIFNIEKEMPEIIFIDELRLRQILLNLVSNAVKFTNKGQIMVKIMPLMRDSDNKKVDFKIIVEDTGIGIPKEAHNKIFEPFKQYDEKTTKRFGGTGLGLAITKNLVEMLNGSISVESKLDKGSEFILKFKNIDYQESKKIQKHEDADEIEQIRFTDGKVLIVDDVATNRDLIKGYLTDFNLELYEAPDGQQAVILAKEKRPDVILMDIRMPVMDGFAAVDQIKSDENIKNTVILAISATILPEEIRKIGNRGFVGFLQKPINMYELYSELKKYLPYETTISKAEKQIREMPVNLDFDSFSTKDGNLLISELETDFMPKYELVKKTLSFKMIKKFSKDLEELGKKHNCLPIMQYGEGLFTFAKHFDIQKINKLLDFFPGLMSLLKKHC